MEWRHHRRMGGRRGRRRRRWRQGDQCISWCPCIGGVRPPTAELRSYSAPRGRCPHRPIERSWRRWGALPPNDIRWSWCSRIRFVRLVIGWSSTGGTGGVLPVGATPPGRPMEQSWRRWGTHPSADSRRRASSSSLLLRL